MDISSWLPMSPTEGPPLPKVIDQYLPWKGYWPWYKAAGGGTTPGASGFKIVLYDQNGNVIVSSGIASLDISAAMEGSIVKAVIGVTNTSTQAGQPSAATFTVKFKVTTPSQVIVSEQSQPFAFAASQSIQIDSSKWAALSFTVPAGTGGTTATATATLLDPSGNVLQTATANFNIATAPIIYGGTISFT